MMWCVSNMCSSYIYTHTHTSCIGVTYTFNNSFLQCEMDQDTEKPLDILNTQAQQLIQTLGSRNTKISEIIAQEDRAVFTAIQKGLDRVNERATPHSHKVGTPRNVQVTVLWIVFTWLLRSHYLTQQVHSEPCSKVCSSFWCRYKSGLFSPQTSQFLEGYVNSESRTQTILALSTKPWQKSRFDSQLKPYR